MIVVKILLIRLFCFLNARCIYARLCVPFPNYKKITGLDLIRIQGSCVYGCNSELLTVSYSYKVFNNLKYSDFAFTNIVWQEFEMTKTYFSDWTNPYFEVSSVLFNDFRDITYWKVELTVFTTTLDKVTENGTSSLILKINQTPFNGTCLISQSNGIAFQTYFTINCSDWIDSDGYITSYEFYGYFVYSIYLIDLVLFNAF